MFHLENTNLANPLTIQGILSQVKARGWQISEWGMMAMCQLSVTELSKLSATDLDRACITTHAYTTAYNVVWTTNAVLAVPSTLGPSIQAAY